MWVVVFGAGAIDAVWLEQLRAGLPDAAQLTLAGSKAHPDYQSLPQLISGSVDARGALCAAAERYPGEDLLLVLHGLELPELWFQRLARAAAEPNVLVASPLTNSDPAFSPLPAGRHSAASSADIDAICFAYGQRALIDSEGWLAALSYWNGAALAKVGAGELLGQRLAARLLPLRAVTLDHLYVARPGQPLRGPVLQRDPRDEPPASGLAALRERVYAALRGRNVTAPTPMPGLVSLPVILHILHGWGGGAQRFVQDLAKADSRHQHLVLYARGDGTRQRYGEALELCLAAENAPPLRRVVLPRPIASSCNSDAHYRAFLDELLRDFCVDAVIVSSLIGHSLDALRSRRPTFVVIHDFYPLWPFLHCDFGAMDRRYDSDELRESLADPAAESGFAERDFGHWHELREAYVAALLAAPATLIAPSRTAMDNLLRIEPRLAKLRRQQIGHGLAPWSEHLVKAAPAESLQTPPARAKRLRLMVLGRIRKGKGGELLQALLPLLDDQTEIFLLGCGAEGMAFFGRRNLHIVFDYQRDRLPELQAEIGADGALLLPTVAETFSYTLSEIWALGVPPIATRLGSLAERISDGQDGLLVEPNAAAIASRIAALQKEPQVLATIRRNLRAKTFTSTTEMAAAYATVLALAPREVARYPLAAFGGEQLRSNELAARLGSSERERGALAQQLSAANEELEARVDWGNELNRQLQQRTTWAKSLEAEVNATRTALAGAQLDLSDLQKDFEARTRWALSLDEQSRTLAAEVLRLGPKADELERVLGSFSWRATRPLRAAMARLRNLRAALGFRLRRVVVLAQRARGSLARRGLTGTAARILREFGTTRTPLKPMVVAHTGVEFAPFALPTSETPRASIVIPVYNKFSYTLTCLRSLADHAGATQFEVIVVDDCSSDETAQRLLEISGLHVIRNATNLGFIGACNAGAAAALGEFVVFLNNDTAVTPNWLEALLDTFLTYPNLGLVGAKLVYPDGRLQEAGGIVFSDASGWNYGRGEDPEDPRFNFLRDVDYCSGAAIALRREVFQRLGEFDTHYAPAYYEDTDLAFKVRADGLRVLYQPRSMVVHFEGVTSGTDIGSGTKRYQAVNQEKFYSRWRDVLAGHSAPATRIELARANRSCGRVLIVDATTPTPDQDAGSVRMVNLMRVLLDLGYQVTFFADNRAYAAPYTGDLQALGIEVLYHPWLSDPVAFFREQGVTFCAVLLSRHYVAAQYLSLARQYAPQARLIFDTVDLHYLREEREARLEARAELHRRALATKAQELKLMRLSDVTLVVSPVEQALLARELPQTRVEILATVNEIFGCRKAFAQRRDLVFVGGFEHPPNGDAVKFFARSVWPRVRAEIPDARWHVIGSKAPAEIVALGGNGIEVHGYVAELDTFMDNCRLSVAPLRYGAGVKGKINTAMSFGLPVVATSAAVEGMHFRVGEDILVADDPAELAAAIVRAYRDENLWNRLSANGLENVRRHFSFDAARDALQRILTD